ncbi:DUF4438 domain-containing protein [Candidatus Bathyarchaeota archaeon]|nr:DUF4438 domain-containing protein [Candidatus Bathyarchaeota archaeon]
MIKTNKDNLITLAVQGEIVPSQIIRTYTSTWDGKSKLGIGVGGINYNLKIGEPIWGWANGDRAESGVSSDGYGSDSQKEGYRQKTGVGNEVKLISGEAKGSKGVIVGKHGYRLPNNARHIQLHFTDDVLDKLAIGDRIRVKARSIGLKIDGHPEIAIHSSSPELIEGMGIFEEAEKITVPVVREVPADLIGAGYGTSAITDHIDIQTCYAPDIEKFALDKLKFGDLILVKDLLCDISRHYYRGATTIGIVISGPSDTSGQGIGLTTIMSGKNKAIKSQIDPEANIKRALNLR